MGHRLTGVDSTCAGVVDGGSTRAGAEGVVGKVVSVASGVKYVYGVAGGGTAGVGDGVTGNGVGVGSVYIYAVVIGSAAVVMEFVARDGVVGGGYEVDAGAAVPLGCVARDGL